MTDLARKLAIIEYHDYRRRFRFWNYDYYATRRHGEPLGYDPDMAPGASTPRSVRQETLDGYEPWHTPAIRPPWPYLHRRLRISAGRVETRSWWRVYPANVPYLRPRFADTEDDREALRKQIDEILITTPTDTETAADT